MSHSAEGRALLPSPRAAGRGKGPVACESDGKGEVRLRRTGASAVAAHLTPTLSALKGGEGDAWSRLFDRGLR